MTQFLPQFGHGQSQELLGEFHAGLQHLESFDALGVVRVERHG